MKKKVTNEKKNKNRKNRVELFERNSSAFLKVLEDCNIIGFSLAFFLLLFLLLLLFSFPVCLGFVLQRLPLTRALEGFFLSVET